MAGPNLYIAPVSAVALTASTTKTVVQLAVPATRQVTIKEWGISFDGVDATKTPILVSLLRQSTAGTASALTIVKANALDTTAISTARQTFTVEPTSSDILWSEYISPAGAFDRGQLPLGEEFVMAVSTWVGIQCIVPAGTACNATAYIRFAE